MDLSLKYSLFFLSLSLSFFLKFPSTHNDGISGRARETSWRVDAVGGVRYGLMGTEIVDRSECRGELRYPEG